MIFLKKLSFFVVCFSLCFTAAAQSPAADNSDAEKPANPVDFFIIPILETVFSGEITWRPDWPEDMPPDSFSFLKERAAPEIIEISNAERNYIVKYDRKYGKGRLIEFPLFLPDGYLTVKVNYAVSGAVLDMTVSFYSKTKDINTEDVNTGQIDQNDKNDKSFNNEKIWYIEFPGNFLPYSNSSPGGVFPPVSVKCGDTAYQVFLFESPSFLTETWYSSDGNLLVFCKAAVNNQNGIWNIHSLQIHDSLGLRFQDYFYDSFGNITEIRRKDMVFKALYRDRCPTYWQYADNAGYEMQWDTQMVLMRMKSNEIEYRYEYEKDSFGNWVKRHEIAIVIQSELLFSKPLYSRGIWNRRIVFAEKGR